MFSPENFNSRDKILDEDEITDLSTVVDFTFANSGVCSGTRCILIHVTAGAVRIREGGEDPTSSVGILVGEGATHRSYIADYADLKIIESELSSSIFYQCIA